MAERYTTRRSPDGWYVVDGRTGQPIEGYGDDRERARRAAAFHNHRATHPEAYDPRQRYQRSADAGRQGEGRS